MVGEKYTPFEDKYGIFDDVETIPSTRFMTMAPSGEYLDRMLIRGLQANTGGCQLGNRRQRLADHPGKIR